MRRKEHLGPFDPDGTGYTNSILTIEEFQPKFTGVMNCHDRIGTKLVSDMDFIFVRAKTD